MTQGLRQLHGFVSVPCPLENSGSDSAASERGRRRVTLRISALGTRVARKCVTDSSRMAAQVCAANQMERLVKVVEGETFLEESEVAALLNKQICSLRSDAARRVGPPRIRLGNLILYRATALQKWLLAHERDFTAVRTRNKGT